MRMNYSGIRNANTRAHYICALSDLRDFMKWTVENVRLEKPICSMGDRFVSVKQSNKEVSP